MSLSVLYCHSFVIFYTHGRQDVTNYAFNYFDSGSLAVCVFFLISGMLLTQSFYDTSGRIKFILKRICRIFPALIVCLVFTIVVIGALSTTSTPGQYFSSVNTYRYLYNSLLSNELFQFTIPGSFAGNKAPDIINGSLWTLPYEFICYILLFLTLSAASLYLSTKFRRNAKLFVSVAVLFLCCYMLNGKYLIERLKDLLTGFSGSFQTGNSPVKFFIFFTTGIVLYYLRERIKINYLVFMAIVMLLVICNVAHIRALQIFMEFLTIVYSALLFAGMKSLNKFNLRIDPSYGIYLYAWPIQQLVAYYFNLDGYVSMLFTLPAVLAVGVVSFVYIERPALKYVNRISQFIS